MHLYIVLTWYSAAHFFAIGMIPVSTTRAAGNALSVYQQLTIGVSSIIMCTAVCDGV